MYFFGIAWCDNRDTGWISLFKGNICGKETFKVEYVGVQRYLRYGISTVIPCPGMNRSLSSRQTKKQNVFSRISEMRSWFSFMQLPASCGNPLVQGSLADADAADSCSNE